MKQPYLVAAVLCRRLTFRNVRWQFRDASWELWPEDLQSGVLDRDVYIRIQQADSGHRVGVQLWPQIHTGTAEFQAVYDDFVDTDAPDPAGAVEARFRLRGVSLHGPGMYDLVVLLDGRWLGSCGVILHAS